ncbi:hypothetical protein EDD17DRAFT_1511796 [Pisolithus thermaeus]|nr:hypothetical protein EDD17DRAFT_1511796 [Pisolithus thermaeus]
MATRQMQDGTRQEKPIRPKLQPWSASQSTGGVETETKLNTVKEIDEEWSEISLKARERTILKLRRAIEQAHKQVGTEAELGTVKDINHKQPRGDKTVSKQKGVMKQGGMPTSTAMLSAHMNSGTCEKNAASNEVKTGIEGQVKNWNDVVLTPVSENPRQWGFSDLDLPTPRQGQDDEEPNAISQCPSLTARTTYKNHTTIIIDDEHSKVEKISTTNAFDTQCTDAPTPTVAGMKWKQGDSMESDSEHLSRVDTVNEDKMEMMERISRGHQVMSQKSRSSTAPSLASDSVPASDFPKSEATRISNGGSQFTNGDLPPLFLKGRKWVKIVLPMLFLWVRDQPNVWSVPKDELAHALREIIEVIYPTFTTFNDIHPTMPIFSIASQCLSGWHHSLGSTAIALLDCYLDSDSDTDVEQTCDALLHKWAFTYEDLDSSSPDKAFCGAFVLQLLTNTHLHSCIGSVDVPALNLTSKQYRARGAIALSVTAECTIMKLKCTIKLMKSKSISADATEKGKGSMNLPRSNHKAKPHGRPANAEHSFSEQNWGSVTSSYFQSVANHKSHILQGIIRMAHAILQDESDGNSSADDQIKNSLEGEIDACALMCKLIGSVYKKSMPLYYHFYCIIWPSFWITC